MTVADHKKSGVSKTRAKGLLGAALAVPYRFVLLACAVLGIWSLLAAHPFEGAMASDLRTSSVYADASFGLDTTAAERAIGNRRLAVAFLNVDDDGSQASQACKDLKSAADGVLLVVIYRDGDALANYGCSYLPGSEDEFGKAFVAETKIASGIAGFAAQPLDAVKIMATTYDKLADADVVPKQARVIQVPAPRYLLAFIAFGAVIGGAALIYFLARRAGRAVSDERDEQVERHDDTVALNARLAGIAADILTMDERYAALRTKYGGHRPTTTADRTFDVKYRKAAGDYAELAARAAAVGTHPVPVDLPERVERLAGQVESIIRSMPTAAAR